MTISELIQAKSDSNLVNTPLGTGNVNGIGGKFTYVYFQDSPDSVAGKLVEFPNSDIEMTTEFCPTCKSQVEFETKLDATGLNNICVNCGGTTK